MNRMRRLRVNEQIRAMVRETTLNKSDLVYPVFVIEGVGIKNPISSMPGIFQYSLDRIDEEIDRVVSVGVNSIIIFGIPEYKDEVGSQAYAEEGITQKAIRYIKEKRPHMIVIADVCLCEYTSHGHCGLIRDGIILNDETLPLLSQMAVSMAETGADIIAPSDMMDGRVKKLEKPWMMQVLKRCLLCHIVLSMHRHIIHLLGRQPIQLPVLGIEKHIRWTMPTGRKLLGSVRKILKKGQIY